MGVESGPRRVRLGVRDERGQVIAFAVLLLIVLLAVSVLVIDVGHAFWAKRKLQSSADAAALAAAYDLPNTAAAMAAARAYGGAAGGRNHEIPGTVTDVCIAGYPATATCSPQAGKVIVVERATVSTFFGGLVGVDSFNIRARAVAGKSSTATGTPLAIYVHELCGAATGNKGLLMRGENTVIEGGIHVNGNFTITANNFTAKGSTTVYRPPQPGSPSPPGPAQGTCDYPTHPLQIRDTAGSRYCTLCPGGAVSDPVAGPYRDWLTGYHTAAHVTDPALGGIACTHTFTTNHTINNNTIIDTPRVYCLPPDKTLTISDNVTGPGGTEAPITVVAGYIKLLGAVKLKPANQDAVPVTFYSTNTTGAPLELRLQGTPAFSGYAINRFGGIVVEAERLTSPFKGLLEAEWVEIRGNNFTMLGIAADSSEGGSFGAPALEG